MAAAPIRRPRQLLPYDTMTRMIARLMIVGLAATVVADLAGQTRPAESTLAFDLVQPEIFGAPGGQPNAWADFDSDGDLDLFVGFRGRPNRLYRQTAGRFEDVAASVGLADTVETRAAAWGDYDGDGDPDLYVGYATAEHTARIYRNDRARFTDVTTDLGIKLAGVSRQPAWIDFDGDGDLDLFAAFRDQPNRLFRNDGGRFADVTPASGIGDPRKTVGGVWWDVDRDGDLDLFVANQEGDANGLFRNDGGRFADVAGEFGVSAAGRAADLGGVGPGLGDFDLDGDFDLVVANYGPSALYQQQPDRHFVDVARAAGVNFEGHATTTAVGDLDGDGRPDLYLGAFLAPEPHYRDWLYLNRAAAGKLEFAEALPSMLLENDASHGVQIVDFDADGLLDLSLTNNDAAGRHALLRNVTTNGGRGMSVVVADARGRLTRAGAEVRIFDSATGRLIGAGLVDGGSGYCSQNAGPAPIGLPRGAALVDVEVTVPARGRRSTTRMNRLEPGDYRGRPLVVRASGE
jgi:hypothetical protein